MNIFLGSQSLEDQTIEKAPWYDTKYSVSEFDEEMLKRIRNPSCEIKEKKLDFPPANTMVPKNFDILPEDKSLS